MTLFSILFSKNLDNIPLPFHLYYHCLNSVSHLFVLNYCYNFLLCFPSSVLLTPYPTPLPTVLPPVAITKYHRLGTYKQQTFIFHSPRSWLVQDQGTSRFGVWWRPFPGSQMATFHYVLIGWKGQSISLDLLDKALISLMGSILMT